MTPTTTALLSLAFSASILLGLFSESEAERSAREVVRLIHRPAGVVVYVADLRGTKL